jgi:hypothetical protein
MVGQYRRGAGALRDLWCATRAPPTLPSPASEPLGESVANPQPIIEYLPIIEHLKPRISECH